ncbi:hypothetical protein O181_094056 [Austropuccinia psidii MF-1]|uniref:Uncharacterized protein n=1 Tax=Austropuccinia psidii MF-1 TaxID=1389203 RepID=A0A9Q3J2P0_9BASI|nr:hypothetical protein [Austropuccinia psidii MF-1]
MWIQLDRFKSKFLNSLNHSVHARSFLLITTLESTIDIILESIIIIKTNLYHDLAISFDNQINRNPLAVYLSIFILAHLFQIYFAIDALRFKNTIQLIGLCAFNLAILTYAIIQIPEIKKIQTPSSHSITNSLSSILLIGIPAWIGLAQIFFVYLTWHLFKEFGWQIYKQIGADRKIKKIYLMYQIYICLLKFDYFFFIAFSLQLVLLVPSVHHAEKVLTIIAVPTTLILLIIGYYGVQHESKSIMWAFMLGLLSGSYYFVYKLFRIWQGRHDRGSYAQVFKSLTVFSVSCLLMIFLSFLWAMICLKNFGQGLKVHMKKQANSNKKSLSERWKPKGTGSSEFNGSCDFPLSSSVASLTSAKSVTTVQLDDSTAQYSPKETHSIGLKEQGNHNLHPKTLGVYLSQKLDLKHLNQKPNYHSSDPHQHLPMSLHEPHAQCFRNDPDNKRMSID